MKVEIAVPGADSLGRCYLTWSPTRATARLLDGPGAGNPVTVRLKTGGSGGQLLFGPSDGNASLDTLDLSLPGDGVPANFLVAGKFGRPSTADQDTLLQAVTIDTSAALGSTAVMVRIRKNAIAMTPGERDRMVSALGTLNDRGMGKFSDFRSMHTNSTVAEAHGNSGFLPWHRAYLLDLERSLQRIDSSVTLPYWRFDQAAAKLFSLDFMGVPNSLGRLQFVPGHPFEHWATDQTPGILRKPDFPISGPPAGVRNEAQTMALGGAANLYAAFLGLEGNPHGQAHVSFTGYIDDIDTAAKDPLFFLLHANVDRLWAKWQWFNHRFDQANSACYAAPNPPRIGHNLADTMWPWNGIVVAPRPSSAPGGPFPKSPAADAPGATPAVLSMMDYQGVVNRANRLGFDYDDVPFEP